jgi:hypothetical protein
MELSSFIGSTEWEKFAVSYRTRQFAGHAAAAQPARFASQWSRWELDAQIQFTRLAQDEGFRLFTRGKQVPRETYLDPAGNPRADVLQRLWASGVSITLRRLEDYSNPTLALTRRLEAFARCPVQVNLYVTPGEGQGLGAHFDDHDVLVLQIQGTKTWEIYAASTGGSRPTGAPTVVTLQPGGWLYVPKGTWHEVRNKAAEPSIHFTTSFHPLTWGQMIREALARAERTEPTLNATCPADGDYAAEIARGLARVQAAVAPPADYYREFHQLEVQLAAAELTARARLDAATRFSWRAADVTRSPDDLELNLAYRRRPLRLRAEIGATIRAMAARGTFCSAELETLEPEIALRLCRLLANVGVLRLEA